MSYLDQTFNFIVLQLCPRTPVLGIMARWTDLPGTRGLSKPPDSGMDRPTAWPHHRRCIQQCIGEQSEGTLEVQKDSRWEKTETDLFFVS